MYIIYAPVLSSFNFCASCTQQYLAPARTNGLPQLSVPLTPTHICHSLAFHNTAFTPRTRNSSRFTLTIIQSRNSSLFKGHSLASGSSPAGVVIHLAVSSSLRRLRGTTCRTRICVCQPRHPTNQPGFRGNSAAYTELQG